MHYSSNLHYSLHIHCTQAWLAQSDRVTLTVKNHQWTDLYLQCPTVMSNMFQSPKYVVRKDRQRHYVTMCAYSSHRFTVHDSPASRVTVLGHIMLDSRTCANMKQPLETDTYLCCHIHQFKPGSFSMCMCGDRILRVWHRKPEKTTKCLHNWLIGVLA